MLVELVSRNKRFLQFQWVLPVHHTILCLNSILFSRSICYNSPTFSMVIIVFFTTIFGETSPRGSVSCRANDSNGASLLSSPSRGTCMATAPWGESLLSVSSVVSRSKSSGARGQKKAICVWIVQGLCKVKLPTCSSLLQCRYTHQKINR